MNPTIWGPPFWFVLHTIAIAYPENPTFIERRNHYDFFRNLQSVVPCTECRRNYCAHFKKYPIETFLDNKYSLLQWTIIMHNLVNKLNGEPQMTTQEVVSLYRKVYEGQAGDNTRMADRYCQSIPRNADGSTRCTCGDQGCPSDQHFSPTMATWKKVSIGLVLGFTVLATGFGVGYAVRGKSSNDTAA